MANSFSIDQPTCPANRAGSLPDHDDERYGLSPLARVLESLRAAERQKSTVERWGLQSWARNIARVIW